MEKNRTKINVLDAESKLQAGSDIRIPSGDVINDVSNADWFQSCGLFPSCHGRGGRFVTWLPSRALPRLGLPAGLAMAATPGGGEPWEGWPGLHLPRFAARSHFNPFCSRVQLVTKHILFFLMGKRVAASFHSNTYAHNIVCSCHHCWRGWLLLCLAGTVVVSFCPCSEGPRWYYSDEEGEQETNLGIFCKFCQYHSCVFACKDMKQSGEAVSLQEGFPCRADHHH